MPNKPLQFLLIERKNEFWRKTYLKACGSIRRGSILRLSTCPTSRQSQKPKKAKQNQRSNLMSELVKAVTMDFNQIFGTMVFIGGHFVPNVTLRL